MLLMLTVLQMLKEHRPSSPETVLVQAPACC